MDLELVNHNTGRIIIKLEDADPAFGGNMFNLTMVELAEKYGPSFKKLSSESLGGRGISLIYTHNISGVLKP